MGPSEKYHGSLHWEAEFPLRETHLLKYIDPYSGRVLLYCSQTSIQILHWRDGNRRSTISLQSDDLDQGVRIVSLARGSYPHCARHTSVEWDHILATLWPVYPLFQGSLGRSIPRPYGYPHGRLAHASAPIRSGLLSIRVSLPRTRVALRLRRRLHPLHAHQRRLPRDVPLLHPRDYYAIALHVSSRSRQGEYPGVGAAAARSGDRRQIQVGRYNQTDVFLCVLVGIGGVAWCVGGQAEGER